MQSDRDLDFVVVSKRGFPVPVPGAAGNWARRRGCYGPSRTCHFSLGNRIVAVERDPVAAPLDGKCREPGVSDARIARIGFDAEPLEYVIRNYSLDMNMGMTPYLDCEDQTARTETLRLYRLQP